MYSKLFASTLWERSLIIEYNEIGVSFELTDNKFCLTCYVMDGVLMDRLPKKTNIYVKRDVRNAKDYDKWRNKVVMGSGKG